LIDNEANDLKTIYHRNSSNILDGDDDLSLHQFFMLMMTQTWKKRRKLYL